MDDRSPQGNSVLNKPGGKRICLRAREGVGGETQSEQNRTEEETMETEMLVYF